MSTINCPSCGSKDLRRSATFVTERARRWLFGGDPYRCRDCNWRGWRRLDDEGSGTVERKKSRAPRVDPSAALGAVVIVLLLLGVVGLIIAFNSNLFASAPSITGSGSGAVQ